MNDMQMAREIARLVSEKGGRAYLVGGIVRDAILGKENKDIDVEIHGVTPGELENILNQVGQPTEMGASFGVFGLKGYSLDIAMPRREVKTGEGHKDFKVDVDPFLGVHKAALRRDFTINALMQDVLTGEIIDNFGGVRDLEEGILRHVNDESFPEDPLRVLRAAQFAARYDLEIAPETIELCCSINMGSLAPERIFGELKKALLKADKPGVFFQQLRKMDQLDLWFPEMKALIDVPQNPKFHPEGDVWNHTMLVLDRAAEMRQKANEPLGFMLAAMIHDVGKANFTTIDDDGRIRSIGHEKDKKTVEAALSRITNESKLKRYVHNMTELHMRPNSLAAQTKNKKAYFKLFDLSVDPRDLLLLAKADHMGRTEYTDYEEPERLLKSMLEAFEDIMAKPQVMGRDLIEAGMKPGKEFTRLLDEAHRLHLSGVDKENALKQVLAMNKEKRL